MLKAWLSYCGISVGGEVNIPHYLMHATQNPAHGFVKGWGLRDLSALSLIANTSDKRVQIPDTWALDADGNATTDPNVAEILMPAGGPKGSGLALIFQCLTSLMVDNPLLVPVLRGAPKTHNQNSLVAAIDIDFFVDVDTYRSHADNLIDELKKLPRADGFDEILVPGEPEQRTFDDRNERGVPLPPGTIEKIQATATRFGLASPV